MTSPFEKPVRVGDSKYVHALSAYYADETRCGLQNQYPAVFAETTDEVTCPHCIKAKAA